MEGLDEVTLPEVRLAPTNRLISSIKTAKRQDQTPLFRSHYWQLLLNCFPRVAGLFNVALNPMALERSGKANRRSRACSGLSFGNLLPIYFLNEI